MRKRDYAPGTMAAILQSEVDDMAAELAALRRVDQTALTIYKLIAHNGMTGAEQDARDDLVDALAAADAWRKETT